MDYDDFDYCGTLDLYALDDAVEAYKAGEPIPEGITIDEVEMTVLDDWENVGSMSEENCPVDLYAPLLSVPGEKPERMMFDWDINGFKPERGHEYKLRVRRCYFTNGIRLITHQYDLIEVISDRETNA